MYEKLLYNQLYSYVDNILSPNQSRFRKGDSAQQCFLVMIEKFKESIDKGVHLTDLPKAFDCIDDLQCFRFCLKLAHCAADYIKINIADIAISFANTAHGKSRLLLCVWL